MTRVSLGVQSLDSGILRLLGREHTPDQALRSVEMLKMRECPISTWTSCSPYRANPSPYGKPP